MKTFARFAVLLTLLTLAVTACGSDSADELVVGADELPTNDSDIPLDEIPVDGESPDLPDGPLGAGPYPIAHLIIDFDDATIAYQYEISCLGDTATVVNDDSGVNDGPACLALAEFDVQARLTNPPADQLCTSEYGGPETAHITGTINDVAVDTTVKRTDGCGISDWGNLLAAILPTPGDGASETSQAPAGDELMVSCSGPSWPISAFRTAQLFSQSNLPSVELALGEFLGAGEGSDWPQQDWRLLSQTSNLVTLLHVDADIVAYVAFEPTENGYRFEGGAIGGCNLEVAVPDGMNTVDWELDPDYPAPTATSIELHVLAIERECASGQLPGDRLLPPTVVESTDTVLLSFVAEAQSGMQECQGNPATPIVVVLAEPLGNRSLTDGPDLTVSVADLVPPL